MVLFTSKAPCYLLIEKKRNELGDGPPAPSLPHDSTGGPINLSHTPHPHPLPTHTFCTLPSREALVDDRFFCCYSLPSIHIVLLLQQNALTTFKFNGSPSCSQPLQILDHHPPANHGIAYTFYFLQEVRSIPYPVPTRESAVVYVLLCSTVPMEALSWARTAISLHMSVAVSGHF